MVERSKEHAQTKSLPDTFFWLFVTYLAFLIGGFIVYGADQEYLAATLGTGMLNLGGIVIGAAALAAHVVFRYIHRLKAVRALREFAAARDTDRNSGDGFAVLLYGDYWIATEAAIGVLLRLSGSGSTSAAHLVGGGMIALAYIAFWAPFPSIQEDIAELGLRPFFGRWGVALLLLGAGVAVPLIAYKVIGTVGWLVVAGGFVAYLSVLRGFAQQFFWWNRI